MTNDAPTMTAQEPRLRVVDAPGGDTATAPSVVDATVPPQEQAQLQPQPQTTPSTGGMSLLRALAFEASVFGLSGAAAGVLAAPVRKRPRGALYGAMGSVGVYGLFRAFFGKGLLPMSYRIGAGVLGLAMLGGSGYLAFRKQPTKPRRKSRSRAKTPAQAQLSGATKPKAKRRRKRRAQPQEA